MPVALSLFLVLFFLLMNAFFVVSEFALVRVRKSQVDIAIEEGRAGAKYTKLVADNVNAYLSACQLGITLASLALGWLGEPAVSALFEPLFKALNVPEAATHGISIVLGFVIITALHIVVGELIPKSLAIFSTERYALFTATPLVWFYRITYPIMWLFNSITNGVMKLLGHDIANEHEVYTDEEIKLLIDESTESGLIDPEQNEYVDNIFDLGDKDAEAIMTPRTDLVCIDLEDSLEENMALLMEQAIANEGLFYRLLYLQRSLTAASSLDDMLMRFHRWARDLGLAGASLRLFPDRWRLGAPSNHTHLALSRQSFEPLRIQRLGQEQHYLGPLNGPELLVVLPEAKAVGSVAMSMLGSDADLGVVLFTSRDASHYQQGQGTQLLHEIALMLPELLARWIERV